MQRCLQLAGYGKGSVAPNPMVGSVIVYGDRIVGEGFHRKYGEAHAEVNAIGSVENQSLLKDSTLYVNLEPCSHYGKTPPCSELIIKKQIPRVVVGHQDPYPEVSGRGIRMLRDAGVEVITGVLPEACESLNRPFLTFIRKKRPYIILKWAESDDGYIDYIRTPGDGNHAVGFSNFFTQSAVHKMRAEESAVLVGTNTVLLDNPRLNVRFWSGRDPLRITIDETLKIPESVAFFDGSVPTLVFTAHSAGGKDEKYCKIDFSQPVLPRIMDELYRRKVQSLIVEGGSKLLQSFISEGLWDEAQVETAGFSLNSGVKSPALCGKLSDIRKCENSIISTYKNDFIP
ncbi:MAG: bifunctional diaminohydroxyphosphoribosylaminopyrimidine deaminase/5-amino-6-(5-phosphoribosylamino)uracil reductase RibD [Dysgonamonadaceae bacterium]|jgi:diaminohydroxyphosphoribosylaminopyrimidine deaminase/5-amino-6-(5-phosphoribosylamino)uracil reductase|nr:bifunctional diaminohydroxyphosphoribosylaminopyrimidine deaminase/5-amino-6-(5-phosphoribosylamino)uracil reductase RibD [Dysgonamonadaceae bacterium]